MGEKEQDLLYAGMSVSPQELVDLRARVEELESALRWIYQEATGDRDWRVVETAALIVLEPIFEADLQPEQYAYREGHSAQAAVKAVHQLLIAGYREVVDADLSGYFDSIPHAELMQCIARRVSDKAVLHLIKLWLVAPVEEKDSQGRIHRTTRNKDEGRGSPQGAPMTPPCGVPTVVG